MPAIKYVRHCQIKGCKAECAPRALDITIWLRSGEYFLAQPCEAHMQWPLARIIANAAPARSDEILRCAGCGAETIGASAPVRGVFIGAESQGALCAACYEGKPLAAVLARK